MSKSLMLFGRRAYRFGDIRKFWACHIWGLFLCLFRRKSRVESDVCKWNYGRDQTHPNSATWPNKSAEAGGPSELVHSLGWPGASWKVFTVVLLLPDSPLCFLAFQLSHLLPRMFFSHFSAWQTPTQWLRPGFCVTVQKPWPTALPELAPLCTHSFVHTQQPS